MRAWEKAAALGVVAVAVFAGLWAFPSPTHPSPASCAGSSSTPWAVSDVTPQLGGTFSPGAIQSFGSNGSEIWVGGVGSYNSSKDRFFSSPLLSRLGGLGA